MSSDWTEERCQRTDYFYDEGGGTSNGRLTRVRWNWHENGLPCTTGGGFEERYGYNAAGRILSKELRLTQRINGVTTFPAQLIANWTYNNEGNVTSVTYPERSEGLYLSRRVVNHGFDGMARLNAVDTRLPTEAQQNPGWQSVISNVQFNAFGAVTSLNHLGVTETRQYNVLGQMTRMTKGSLIDMEYRFSATANDGKIISQKNWLNGEDVVYQYDELERLISASTTAGGNWGLTWSYDGFGNRLSQNVSQGSGPANVVLVNGNTNRISSSGYGYDLNGNMTTMPRGTGSMTLNYDLSNRVSSISSVDGTEDYVYAPDNRRVWRSAGRTSCRASRGPEGEQYWAGYAPGGEYPTEQVVFYSPGGQKMGVYCLSFTVTQPTPNYPWPNSYYAVTASEENVYYGGRLVGKRMIAASNGSSLVTDFTTDRLQSKGDGSRFYPYGESKTGASGDDREQFATYTRDEQSGLDYANQRWYASGVGRFNSPDPAVKGSNSNSSSAWNQYLYVLADPVGFTDRKGLAEESPFYPEYCYTMPEHYTCDQLPSNQGPTGQGDPNYRTPGQPDFLVQSISRVSDRLSDTCAKSIGAKSSLDAKDKLNKIKIEIRDLGGFEFRTIEGKLETQKGIIAQYNPILGFRKITLNMNVNWLDPSRTSSIVDGIAQSVDFLASNARALGIKSLSAQDFIDLTLLHELAHAFGINKQDKDERFIWDNCFN